MAYRILNYTLEQASKLGVTVKPSSVKGKKIDVFNDCFFGQMNEWAGVMPVLRIVVDEWMGGCNARFKYCYGWMDGWV